MITSLFLKIMNDVHNERDYWLPGIFTVTVTSYKGNQAV